MAVFAGIDIGTLTCRLLIAKVEDRKLIELHSERRLLRLGEGVDRHRKLDRTAMERVIATLGEWRRTMDRFQVKHRRAVATSAVRDAENRTDFLRLARDAGFEVEVISGHEEAHLTMLGIRSGFSQANADILSVDIGGGSTEFILDRCGRPPIVRSVDIGVVRLTERFLAHDPPAADEVDAVRDCIKQETSAVLPLLGDLSGTLFIGTAGTITTLAAMVQGLRVYEAARIHQYRLTLETVREMEQALLARTKAQRRMLPGLENGREDVIVAGVLILTTVMNLLERRECVVSDLGLREGVLIDLAERVSGSDPRPA